MTASTLTTADLPESLRAPVEAMTAPVPAPAHRNAPSVLTCIHGPACPACVLAHARAILEADASLCGGDTLHRR